MPNPEDTSLSSAVELAEPGLDRVALAAYVLMVVFVLATSVGCGLAFGIGYGLIALGATSGLYGYLLGKE